MLSKPLSAAVLILAIGLLGFTESAPNQLHGRVVGGEDAADAQFPHQISLRNRGSHSCGGSIISRYFVLTAVHCVATTDENGADVPYPPSYFTVRAGSNDRLMGGVIHQVAEVILHEDHGSTYLFNDVALLRVEDPFIFSKSIQPIALPSANTPGNVDIVISGWGRLRHQGDLPRYLQFNTLKSLSPADCVNHVFSNAEEGLCLKHEKDNGACNGDSGGPAMYKNEVVGIAGFVVNGCGSTYPDGYARVYHFKDWIIKHSDL